MNIKTKLFSITLLFISGYFMFAAFIIDPPKVNSSDFILDTMNKMEDDMPLHFIAKSELDSIKIEKGYKLVTTGFMSLESKRQSKHFVCTDCHNIEREDPDLTQSNPDTRLQYVSEKGLKFLPATTLYGTVNKKHWYNDDYYTKYGDLVVPARDTLENAIQLCATVCSQGRALDEKEMESVMHYLNSIGYTVKDLNLTKEENSMIANSVFSGTDKAKSIKLIKSKYLGFSPATFMKPMSLDKRKYGKGLTQYASGNPFNGKKIYELSCLTCHQEGGVTNYKLHSDKLTFKHLKYWSNTHKIFSVYDITRKGTYAKNGYKPYMPNYTKERLSDRQLDDLLAYINQMAEGGKLYRTTSTPSF